MQVFMLGSSLKTGIYIASSVTEISADVCGRNITEMQPNTLKSTVLMVLMAKILSRRCVAAYLH